MSSLELTPGPSDSCFRVTGELTFDTATEAVAAGERCLVRAANARVDLSGVSHADSAGLAVLVDWLALVREAGGELAFVSPPEQLLAIARVSGVDGLLAFTSAGEPRASDTDYPTE